jgi:Ran GTPase-activating protein (RanGAP) involved in mRNA processing and transport
MMKENESITDLNLGFNEIGVQGTKQICETIKTSCSLVKLNLRFNELGPEGGALIVDALRFNDGTLKAIVMTDNHIGAKTGEAECVCNEA